jgi:integrative and conjugative element protein (TIGR02256 family)
MTLQHPFARGAYILIDSAVLQGMAMFRQRGPSDPEAGGILLGMRRAEHLHCTAFTCPGPQDRRARTEFHRARGFHQAHALRHWNESKGLVDYLGEWHTHPERRPSPSGVDRREWQSLIGRYQVPLLFAVVGMDESMWFGLGSDGHFEEAREIDID